MPFVTYPTITFIEALAEARNIEYAKLNKGLGLTSMSFPDIDEDAASMGANAVLIYFKERPQPFRCRQDLPWYGERIR